MRDELENAWTVKISELLKKELDNERYEITCFERVPYSVNIKGYENNKEILEVMKYEVDLLIKEKRDNSSIPRLIIESKYRKITTHDVITYNNKAKAHKSLYSGLRYGLMIGNNVEKNISPRIINHSSEFDFMFAFPSEMPTDEEWKTFVEIVKRNLEVSNKLENIISDRRKKEKKRYYCIEKKFVFYE